MNTQSPPPPSLPDRSEKESEIRHDHNCTGTVYNSETKKSKECEGECVQIMDEFRQVSAVIEEVQKYFHECGVFRTCPHPDKFLKIIAPLSRHQYAEELKKAFIAYFRGSGEHWFPSAANGHCSEEEEIEVAENKWNDVLSLLERKGEK